MLDFSEYMENIFRPVTIAAGELSSLGKFRTADLEGERKEEQISRLKALRVLGDGPLLMYGGSFLARFRCGADYYLCIGVEQLVSFQRDELAEHLIGIGLNEVDMEECFLLFFCSEMKGYYKVKVENLYPHTASNLLSFPSGKYTGHDIFDVIKWYEDVAIYKIPADNMFVHETDWFVAANIAVSVAAFRPPIIEPSVATRLGTLNSNERINSEIIYFAVTSVHNKHMFMDLYRCIENIYYLPWMVRLREKFGGCMTAFGMAKNCNDVLQWRRKEDLSIQELFEMVPDHLVRTEEIRTVRAFREISVHDCERSAIGRRVYKIRNQLVHQIDYDDSKWTHVTDKCWGPIISMMINVIEYLYVNFEKDIQISVANNENRNASDITQEEVSEMAVKRINMPLGAA